jgi:hypothetical protein
MGHKLTIEDAAFCRFLLHDRDAKSSKVFRAPESV